MERTKTENPINYELHQLFLDSIKEEGNLAEGTIANLARDIGNYLDFLDKEALEISAQSVTSYIEILEDKYNEASFISKLSNLRRFINWINLDKNPFWKLKASLSKDDLFYYEKDRFEDFYHSSDLKSMIILTLYETCSQISEVAELSIGDYNLAGGYLSLRSKPIKLSEHLASTIKEFIKSKENPQLDDALFISSSEISLLLKEANLKNTLIKRSRIIHLLKEENEIADIEKQLKLKLSNFYNDFIQKKDYRLLSAYNQFHPRASLN